ncbi:MAG TPA: DUF6311 domain-containing protein [Casimicrobiaceae bacterium]|nr:DUF6311 domain-containing protein [Casimicrobiaceae bacterium]
MSTSRVAPAVTAALLGPLVFFVLFDPRLLDPSYFQWLFWLPDPATQFLGWHFFRLEGWHLPPGAATNYGMEMGSSIVFTDSIPLLALLFKLVRAALPDKFQYFGVWMLACYTLQAVFAWLLSGMATRLVAPRLVITALFVLSPLLPDRAIGHYALMAQWLVLAALYLYLRAPTRLATASWCFLICGAALIHAYLLYMVLAVAVADAARRRWIDRTATTLDTVRSTLVIATALLATMWAGGYFRIPAASFSGGTDYYGRYAANLNALWNPQWGSLFLPEQPTIPGAGLEGYGYLGLGVLAMLPIAAYAWWRNPRGRAARRYLPLAAVALLLWAIALSNQVAWGDRVLFVAPLPDRVLELVAMVRASGRLLWVGYYALMLAVVAIIVRNLAAPAATLVLLIGLALQIADLSPRYLSLHAYFRQHFIVEPAQRTDPLPSPFWAAAARHYRTILFVPSLPVPPDFSGIALFAADHGMRINIGSFARLALERVAGTTVKREQALAAGRLDQEALYVLRPAGIVPFHAGPDDGVGSVDGFLVLVPGWFRFEDCCGGAMPPLARAASVRPAQ